ncbi:MAG: FixH family protein [Alphaproteobacteria bacterium]
MGKPRQEKKLTGWHVIIMLLLFFGLIVSVNTVFLVAAVKSFTGEDVKGSYRTGLEYNQRIEQRATERGLGWTVRANVIQDQTTNLIFAISDASSLPLSGLSVEGVLRHPTDRAFDRPVTLQAGTNGTYRASVDIPPANWRFMGEATQGDTVFTFQHDVSVE